MRLSIRGMSCGSASVGRRAWTSRSINARCPCSTRKLERVSGGYRLTDRGSTNGTRVFRRGRWREVATETVGANDRLELGDYRTTAAELVGTVAGSAAGGEGAARPGDRPAGPVGARRGQPSVPVPRRPMRREDHELEELLEASDLEAGLSGLVATAKCRGGESCDNISAAAARSRPAPATVAKRMRRVVRRWRGRGVGRCWKSTSSGTRCQCASKMAGPGVSGSEP